MVIPPEWAAQKLAEFLAAVSAFTSGPAAALGAVERVAEALDAEVAAIIDGGELLAAIGYPAGEAPVGELDAVARGTRRLLTVPGSGLCPATVVELVHPPGARLVVARSSTDALCREEIWVLQGMARLTAMALRTLSLLDAERALRRESERQGAENARLFARLTEHQQLLERSAEEQASLRRVATLVAQGLAPDAIFTAVASEIARISDVDTGMVLRYEADDTATVVAKCGTADIRMAVGSNWSLDGDSVTARVFRTRRPARLEGYGDAAGPIAKALPGHEFSSAGAPIVIGDRLWGVAVTTSATLSDTLPADAEERIANFADLIATAISNAEARTQLTASRARVVAAADDARRRLERDLHDGVQQGLVSLALVLRSAAADLPAELQGLRDQLELVENGLADALGELREISRGIHPAILSEGGLGPALKALARRSAVPVELQVQADRRVPERIGVAVYYVVAEALTNAAKHAAASVVRVDVDATGELVRLSISDDGVGGADPAHGSGLIGLGDRVEALGGTVQVTSPSGVGTTLFVTLPIPASPHSTTAAGGDADHVGFDDSGT
ncbi:GAF domain-containing sensor histidine kinase [Pseudonocardia sp. CA-107938]|uniref:GAF domain-containing sensor histidine kinase n=1 Tax=Pseudonocardia sp. CA-107938 TaxID=3240021 RepID=UPI003D900D82